MLLEKVLERFAQKTPVSVMTRGAMEFALCPEVVDELFERNAEQQYTRQLLFSSVVDLMGMVVAKIEPSVNAAYQAVEETLPVTLTAVYDKINRIEPGVTAALVSETAKRLADVVESTGGGLAPLLPGYRIRIIDGNHFPATERRLEVLHRCQAGPLPGHALVVLDPSLMLATHMIPCEDGHAQERSLSSDIIELVTQNDVWIADRNFCTTTLLSGIAERGGYFIIRRHGQLPVRHLENARAAGECETGELLDAQAEVNVGDNVLPLREVIVKLD